ncbi:MAG: ArsR/SmtB family transcription factor [Promethearchaeota archaeon]
MELRKCCPQDPDSKSEWEKSLEKQKGDIPSDMEIERIYEILHAVSHPIRLKIAFYLLDQDQCVCELVKLTGKAPNLISHHLMVMRKNTVIKPYMKGGEKYYKVKENIVPILRTIKKLEI